MSSMEATKCFMVLLGVTAFLNSKKHGKGHSKSENLWYHWAVKKGAVFILCGLDLLAQVPAPERFWPGTVVSIESRSETNEYKYTVWNGGDDAFTGLSRTPLRVSLNEKVKCAVIEPRSVYIVDDDGKIQETEYVSQAEMVLVRKTRLPRWFPHWFGH